MKKCLVMILTALLLCGCAPEETFETVTDVAVMMTLAQPREIRVSLPGEAAMPAVESDSGRLYLCEDYEICIQTLEGGDLSATIQTVTGYDKEALTVMGAALIGGSIGCLAGMYTVRHKTKHIKFVVGIPLILAVQIGLVIWLLVR